jgi:hypothetical protein
VSARRTAIVLALIACATAADAARASPPLRPIAAATNVFGDGDHRVAYEVDAGSAVVLDERTWRHRRVPAPAGCNLGGFGAGNVLWSCPSNMGVDLRGVVTSLQTGQSHDLPPQPPFVGNGTGPQAFVAVGSRWARVYGAGYHDYKDAWVNLRTGAQAPPHRQTTREIPDLNTAGLWRPLCRPLRVPLLDADDLGFIASPMAYRPPYAAAVETTEHDADRLLLWHCGQARGRVIAQCAGALGCTAPLLTDRAVAWLQIGLHVRLLRSGRTLVWPRVYHYSALALTHDHVWLVRGQSGHRLLAARI